MKKLRILAITAAAAVLLCAAGCGGGGASGGSSDSGTNITVFNSKMEIQSQLEEKAAEYSEEKGVGVHPNPKEALSDGPQSLHFNEFEELMESIKKFNY